MNMPKLSSLNFFSRILSEVVCRWKWYLRKARTMRECSDSVENSNSENVNDNEKN